MTEFRRLLDDPSEDALARALLRSAREDAPDPKSLLGAAAALGVGAAFAGAAATSTKALSAVGAAAEAGATAAASTGASALAAAAPASAPLLGLLLKPLAFGVVTGLAAMGGLTYVADDDVATSALPAATSQPRVASAPVRDIDRARAPAPVEVTPPSEPVAEPLPAPEAPRSAPPARGSLRDEAPSPTLAVAPPPALDDRPRSQPTAAFTVESPAPAPKTAEAAPSLPSTSELTRQLAREVALLDRARGALGAKDAGGALRALDEYSSERRSGNFDPEAMVLRIRALVELGDRATAARLAKSFVARYPENRHTAWLRSLAH